MHQIADTGPGQALAWSVACTLGGATVHVAGDDAGDHAWLAEFRDPWWSIGEPGSPGARVRVVRSTATHDRLRRQWKRRRAAGRLSPPVPCIRLDSRTVSFEGWSEGSVLHLFDPVTDCIFAVDGSSVDVVAPAGDERARLALLGLVREALVGGAAAGGTTLDLHAAAFAAGGAAVAIAGPKGAGKTSLLCHAILSAGASLLANDRILIAVDDAPPVAFGVPTVVSVRRGTTEAFPQTLARADEFPPLPPVMPRGGRSADGTSAPVEEANLLLTPARFAGRLGAARVGQAPLMAIVVPELSPGLDGWTLEAVPRAQVRRLLAGSLYGVAEDRDRPTLFGALAKGGSAPPTPVADRLASLAAAVPVYRCRLGPAAYRSPAAAMFPILGLERP